MSCSTFSASRYFSWNSFNLASKSCFSFSICSISFSRFVLRSVCLRTSVWKPSACSFSILKCSTPLSISLISFFKTDVVRISSTLVNTREYILTRFNFHDLFANFILTLDIAGGVEDIIKLIFHLLCFIQGPEWEKCSKISWRIKKNQNKLPVGIFLMAEEHIV